MSLITGSPYSYTVSAQFSNFPGITVASSTGLIVIEDPCDNPFELQAANPLQSQTSDYTNPVIFAFGSVTINPGICVNDLVFSCSVASTPASYVQTNDLCTTFTQVNGAYLTQA